jgi:hypothetical protein
MGTALRELALTSSLASTLGPAAESLESDVPSIDTAARQRSVPRWKKCRDVYQGSEAIREGRETYLPRFRGESDALYNARRTIAGLFNGYARTVLASVGLLVEPEPVLDKDMPDLLKQMWENVDGAGMHGAVFARHLSTAAMVDGFAGILTEYPRADDPRIDRSKASLAATIALATGEELDAADVEALGLRPYFILLKADEVLPIYDTVNGKRTLVMLIRKEVSTERKGRFGLKTVTRYRVYELQPDGSVVYERWSANEGTERAQRIEGPTPLRNLTGIPWSPLAAGEKLAENEYKPTLLDLADLTLTHHRIATGILSLEETACVPTLVRVGCPPDAQGNYPDIVTGPGNVIEVPATQGVSQPVYYVSPPVEVLDPAMKSLENCKSEMGATGATFLAPEPKAQETATAHKMDAAAERATIGTVSRGLKDALESAFGFAGQYVKQRAGSVTVNKDFIGEGIDPVLVASMTAAYQAGGLSLQEYRHFLQTGQLPETFDPETIKDILAQSELPPKPAPVDPAA